MEIYDTVRDILQKKSGDAWSVGPETTVYRAIEIMAEKRIGALLVLEDGKLSGILSERDYARKVILKGKSSKETPVREIMTSPVIFVEPRHSVDECMKIITKIITNNRIRHLPVVEEEKVVGIVSIGDIVNWIISAQNHTIQQLQNYVSGNYPP
jgi:CBS domain-containing protein